MSTPSKIVNVDGLGYALVTEAGLGIDQAEKSVTDSASVELTAGLTNRTKLYIKVLDGEGDVYVGDDNVTATTGYLMKAQDELWLDVGPDVAVHAITASGVTSEVRVLETSQGAYAYPARSAGHPSKVVNLDTKGYAAVTQAGSSVKAAAVSVDSSTTKKVLTAGLANRRKLYIKLIGDDVNLQKFLYVGPDDISVGANPRNSKGFPVWARYEAILDVGPDNTVYALKSGGNDPLDTRVLEIA